MTVVVGEDMACTIGIRIYLANHLSLSLINRVCNRDLWLLAVLYDGILRRNVA